MKITLRIAVPFICPSKFCTSIVSTFSWDLKWSQEKTKTMVMQNLGGQTKSIMTFSEVAYRVFSRDVTAAMLVSLNKETAAMLVSPTKPPGIELYYHANLFFCFGGKTSLPIT